MRPRCTSPACSRSSKARRQAVALIERSLELEPDRADWHSNLGIVLQDRLELDEAVAAYERAIALDPEHANAHNNLGVVLRRRRGGRSGSGVSGCRSHRSRALGRVPQPRRSAGRLGRPRDAALCFSKVITLQPTHPEARRLLALAHYTLGDVDKAVEVFEESLAREPDDPIARHMLAACSGRDVPTRASDAFVGRTFDSFALSFDARLARLVYRAPALVSELLARVGVTRPTARRARCGLRHRALRPVGRAVRSAARRRRSVRGGVRPREGAGTSIDGWSGWS